MLNFAQNSKHQLMKTINTFMLAILAAILMSGTSCDKSAVANTKQPEAQYTEDNDPAPNSNSPSEADTLTIAMCGDTMFGTDYPTVRLAANEGKMLFEDTAPITKAADIALGNLEGVFGTTDLPAAKAPGKNSYTFRFPALYAPRLTEAGYDYMCLANNHSRDFGDKGIALSEKALDEQGIAHSGIKGHKEWVVIERNGVKYGVCAFGHNHYTITHLDIKNVERILRELRPKCDILIVTFHGGAEGRTARHLPQGREIFLGGDRGTLREMTHYCIDHGADLVFGHGPHVVRCMELYKGHLIAYSLGNFCTPYGINIADITGYAPVLEARINGKGMFIDGKIHSFIQQPGVGPKTDPTNAAAKEIRSLTDSDISNSQLTISDDGTITRNNQ